MYQISGLYLVTLASGSGLCAGSASLSTRLLCVLASSVVLDGSTGDARVGAGAGSGFLSSGLHLANGSSVGRVDDHDHASLAMALLRLRAVDVGGVGVSDGHGELRLGVGSLAGLDGLELGVDGSGSTGVAWVGQGRGHNTVVLRKELVHEVVMFVVAKLTAVWKLNWTVSPGWALTVLGVKVSWLFAPTATLKVAAETVKP